MITGGQKLFEIVKNILFPQRKEGKAKRSFKVHMRNLRNNTFFCFCHFARFRFRTIRVGFEGLAQVRNIITESIEMLDVINLIQFPASVPSPDPHHAIKTLIGPVSHLRSINHSSTSRQHIYNLV